MEAPQRRGKEGDIIIKFWGARGSIPVPRVSTVKYGGNTSCVEMRLPDGCMLILDAGTGIRELGNHLKHKDGALNTTILLTHYHWDHIQGLPFFRPAYRPNNTITIMGVHHPNMPIEKIISAQMEPIYFPVSLSFLKSKVKFDVLWEGGFDIGDMHIEAIEAKHRGPTLSYKVEYAGRSIVYMTDNELDRKLRHRSGANRKSLDKAVEFVQGADLLIHDAQYTDEEYPQKIGWGHSSWQNAAWLAMEAGAKRLVLFHHDPDRTDGEIDQIIEECNKEFAIWGFPIICCAAMEGMELSL